ncbi:MAG: OmpA family protein [bacterium]|nr:OmpA family protein [bacterium]
MRKSKCARALFTVAAFLGVAGCVTVPAPVTMTMSEVQPKPGDILTPDQVYILADVSGSMYMFDQEKSLVQAFVQAMPSGAYDAGMSSFGGMRGSAAWQRVPLKPLCKQTLGDAAAGLRHLGGLTPLARAVGVAKSEVAGMSEETAIIVFSDGRAKCKPVLAMCEALKEAYDGKVCIYTVWMGKCEKGQKLLEEMSTVTGCGQSWTADQISTPAGMEAMVREIFFDPGPVPKPKPVRKDSDKDGVYDDEDECPNTPKGAKVDSRGCWVLKNLNFDTDKYDIKPEFVPILKEVARVLKKNPKVAVSIDGHTDSDASEAYNQKLSENRSKAVKEDLIKRGIKADRLVTRGFGELKPIKPNDIPENKYQNRRVELTPLKEK